MRNDYYGQPIRLLACETGKGRNCFAQKLANLMRVPVEAPTEIIRARSSGDFEIGTEKGNKSGIKSTLSRVLFLSHANARLTRACVESIIINSVNYKQISVYPYG